MRFQAPASKLPQVGTTIFTVMSRLAAECGAENLSQGFPNWDCDPRLAALLAHHAASGRNQYAPMAGVAELREAIAAKVGRLYGATPDPETEITVTPGATYAVFTAVASLVRPGDEVIVFEPAFDSYGPAIAVQGGVAVPVTMEFPDYRVDWEAVRRALTPRTRMVIINSPHNPTGTVLGRGDLDALADVLRGTGVVLLSDEVYEHIIFDGRRHESVLGHPELAERAFVVSSFGKTFHVTGWKIGYCIAPRALSEEFRRVHQFNCFAVNTPAQHALADYLADPAPWMDLPAFYQAKRDLFARLIEGSRFVPLPSAGTYFQICRYDAISDEPDMRFAERLTREHRVAAIPVSAFYRDGRCHRVVRFCFAKDDATLERAAERLLKV